MSKQYKFRATRSLTAYKTPECSHNFTRDNSVPFDIYCDAEDKVIYLSEISKEGQHIHHVTDGRHSVYLDSRHERPDICITYNNKKDLSDGTGVYPL